jgi:hypothetical protein
MPTELFAGRLIRSAGAVLIDAMADPALVPDMHWNDDPAKLETDIFLQVEQPAN